MQGPFPYQGRMPKGMTSFVRDWPGVNCEEMHLIFP